MYSSQLGYCGEEEQAAEKMFTSPIAKMFAFRELRIK
jgi:hypothetical protein